MSNFSYHGSVWGLNRILRIPTTVIKENANKVFKKCPKTMQTRVKLLIPLLYVQKSLKSVSNSYTTVMYEVIIKDITRAGFFLLS